MAITIDGTNGLTTDNGALKLDTDTLVVDETNNTVGIGTSSPSTSHRLTLDKPTNYGGIEFKQAGTRVGQIIQDRVGNLYVDANTNNGGGSLHLRNYYSDSLVIDPSGYLTKPNQPAFLAKMSSDQTLVDGSAETITFDTEVYDVGSNFNTSTYQFTAPVGGKYVFSYGIRIDVITSGASYYRPQLYISNQSFYDIFDPVGYDSSTSYQSFHMSLTANMDAGDIARVMVRQQGGTISHLDASSGYSWFSGYLLG